MRTASARGKIIVFPTDALYTNSRLTEGGTLLPYARLDDQSMILIARMNLITVLRNLPSLCWKML